MKKPPNIMEGILMGKKSKRKKNIVDETLEEFLDRLGEMPPEQRTEFLEKFADECYDSSNDIILQQHIDDIRCDEVCSTCSKEDKETCIPEIKRAFYYLAQKCNKLRREIEEINNKIDAIASFTLSTTKKEDKKEDKKLDEFDIMKQDGRII